MEWLVSKLLLFKSSSKFKWKYPVMVNMAMYNSLGKIWRKSVTQNFFPSVCVLSSLVGRIENIGGCNYFQHTCEYWTGVLLEYHTQNVNLATKEWARICHISMFCFSVCACSEIKQRMKFYNKRTTAHSPNDQLCRMTGLWCWIFKYWNKHQVI